jgi:hypothetical protein
MTAQPVSGADHPLADALADAHHHAVTALSDGKALDAVVWLSAHLAAGQRTLHVAARRVPTAQRALERARAADRDLEMLLRRTEQHYAGDSLAAQLDETRLSQSLRQALDRHDVAEHEVLLALADSREPEAIDAVQADYDAALRHAPTRPHPHAPHRGLLGAAAFRIDGFRDRIMDTMDGRHVPSPRVPRETVTPGRWGRYVLGEME